MSVRKLIVAAAALLALITSGGAAAVEYFGEYCWQVDSNTPDEPSALLQLGVLNYGANHFPVHGKVTGAGRAPIVVQGNAELTPSIEVSLQGSSNEFGFRQTLTFHLLLDASMNGSYTLVGVEAAAGGQGETLTDEGILTRVPCQ